MESQVSPKNIEARVEALAAASNEQPVVPEVKAPEVKAPETPEVKAPEVKAPEVKAPEVKAPEVKAPEVKAPEVKAPEKKQPNDPAELRKWATKASQDAAAANERIKKLEAAIAKLSKKPVDYAALAKDPDALRQHVDQERAEAAAGLEAELKAERTGRVKSETVVERMRREQDAENYPRWQKLFPLIQTLAKNGDGRVNWNQAPGAALDEAYALANEIAPADSVVAPAAAAVAEPVTPVAEKGMSKAEVDALVAKAKDEARKEAEANLRAEAAGGGVGSKGKGGSRDPNVSSDALRKMPLKDLKTMIQKQS